MKPIRRFEDMEEWEKLLLLAAYGGPVDEYEEEAPE